MTEWVDFPAQVVSYSPLGGFSFLIGDMPHISEIVSINTLQTDIEPHVPSDIVTLGVAYSTLTVERLSVDTTDNPAYISNDPVLVPYDFNKSPIDFGIEVLPIVIIPLNCSDTPYQYWG